MKIVVIGAGSQSFGRPCAADVLGTPEMMELAPELCLVDINSERLDRARRFAEMVGDYRGSSSEITATTDREEALPGADYVLISVTQNRWDLWESDYRVPASHGFHQAYGENGGPGALFHALRNIRLCEPIWRDIERLCPEAVVFNFTNPESRMLLAILTLTKLNAIGLCHGQITACKAICDYTGREMEDLDVVARGINHLYFFQKIADAHTGEDLYPAVLEAAIKDETPYRRLLGEWAKLYGVFTYPNDTHPAEYVSYGAEMLDFKWKHGRENYAPDVELITQAELEKPFEKYLSGEESLEAAAGISRELHVPMMIAHRSDQRRWFISGNVMNTGLYVPNLLPDAVVETPIEVDGDGFHPVTVDPLPESLACLCRTQMSIQKLTVQAYKERSKDRLLEALLLDPVVNSLRRAREFLDDMLELQAAYLPEFK